MACASRRLRLIIPVLAASTAMLAAARVPAPSAPAFDAVQFLETDAGFSSSDIGRVERGEVVARGLDGDNHTVAIAAAAIMAIPAASFVERFRRIEEFKRTPEVLQIGRVGSPPVPGDFAGLTLTVEELDDARKCRVGDCSFKLDAAGIERLRSAGTAPAVMDALRAHLAAYGAAYLRQGDAALIEYSDGRQPLPLRRELSHIVQASPHLERYWPDLHVAVAWFAGGLPPGLAHFLYWSKEKSGSRPIVSLTHAIVRPPQAGVAVIATKQIYSSHYTTASLGLTIVVERAGAVQPRTLVIYINRTRVDIFGGLLGGVKRPLVRSRARAGVERMLRDLRTRLEG